MGIHNSVLDVKIRLIDIQYSTDFGYPKMNY